MICKVRSHKYITQESPIGLELIKIDLSDQRTLCIVFDEDLEGDIMLYQELTKIIESYRCKRMCKEMYLSLENRINCFIEKAYVEKRIWYPINFMSSDTSKTYIYKDPYFKLY